jgi:hypothetical protein
MGDLINDAAYAGTRAECYVSNKKIYTSVDYNECKHQCDIAPGYLHFWPSKTCQSGTEISTSSSVSECANQIR